MKITGKCKIDFEKWMIDNYWTFMDVSKFWQIPFSMQYGVYVDFFDSVDIEVSAFVYTVRINNKKDWSYQIMDSTHVQREIGFERSLNSRAEARTEAIKKANEIYNDK